MRKIIQTLWMTLILCTMIVILCPQKAEAIIDHGYCPECGATYVYGDDDYPEYKYVNSKQHSQNIQCYCGNCGAEWIEETLMNHTLPGACEQCKFPTSSKTLKSGSYTYRSKRPWLKIEIEKSGYIVVNIRSDKGEFFTLYNADKDPYESRAEIYDGQRIPVKKGTYYLRANSDGKHSVGNYSVKYTFKTAANKKNYTKEDAVLLEDDTAVTAIIHSSSAPKTWERWYKIKLTKDSKIRLYIRGYGRDPLVLLYDKKGNEAYTEWKGVSSYGQESYDSQNKLKKGTYYICISDYWADGNRKETTGDVFNLKWKYKK